MKNVFNLLMIATMAVALVFVGCTGNDGDVDEKSGYVIEAKNVQTSSKNIVTVKAQLGMKTYTVKYSNNSFKLILPMDIPGTGLDRSVLFLEGLNKSGDYIGSFWNSGEKGNLSYFIDYVYAKENMNYTKKEENELGGYAITSIYDCVLKKGWNLEYTESIWDEAKKTITYTITTDKPAGVSFAWEFLSIE